MAGTDIEAEKPQNDEAETSRLQGDVVLGGQLTAENGLREVLEIVASNKDVKNGLLRVLSKEIRGYIGVTDGTVISGAQVTSVREYGTRALKTLLSAEKGLVIYMAMQEQPIELCQSMNISLEELLTWRDADDSTSAVPTLTDAVRSFERANFDSVETSIEAPLSLDGGEFGELADEDFESYMAWGGELPLLSSNLARVTGHFGLLPNKAAPGNVIETVLSSLESAAETKPVDNVIESRPVPPPLPSRPVPPPLPPPPPARQKLEIVNEGQVPSASQAYAPEALAAIPTPKTDASAPMPSTTPGANQPATAVPKFSNAKSTAAPPAANSQQQQVSADLDRAMLNQLGTAPPAAPPAKQRHVTQQDQDLSQLVSQRMQIVDPRSFIGDAPRQVRSPVEQRKFEIMAVAGGTVGVLLFWALGQQVFNINTAQSKFESGLKALKKGDNVLAQVDLTTAIKLNGSTPAYFYRAIAETRLGDEKNALQDFNVLIKREPGNLLARMGRVGVYIKTKDYAAAIESCDRTLRLKPDFFEAYRLRALAYCAAGKYKEANEDANTYLIAARKVVDTPKVDLGEALSTRAFAQFKLKRFDESIKDYSEAIELNSKNAHLYSSRAVVYKQVKAWAKALADVETALQLDPSDGTLYKLRGLCYAGTGNAIKAAADLDRAVKLRPSVDTFFLRGEARLEAKDFQGAMEDFEYVVSVTPDNKIAKSKYAFARASLTGKPKTAIIVEDADTASSPATIKLNGEPSALLQQGYTALMAGQADKAIALLTAAVKGDPNSADARRYLAHAFARKGDNASAAAQFKALSTMETLPEADRVSYAKVLAATKQLNSVEQYNSILSADPSNDAARINLIKVCIQSGLVNRAIDLCKDGKQRTSSQQAMESYQALLKQASSAPGK